MAAWEDPELTTFQDTPDLKLHVEPFLLKKNRKPVEQLLHDQGKKGHLEIGEAETWSCQKPHLRLGALQSRRISEVWSFSLRSEGFAPHIRHPKPGTRTRGRSP